MDSNDLSTNETIKSPEIMPFDEYKQLSPEDKERYVEYIVTKILELNNNQGIAIQDITNSHFFFHRHTVSRHLERLVAKRIAYKHPQDSRKARYYLNGRFVDSLLRENIKIGDKFYTFYYLKNQLGEYIYLQEKRKDIYGSFDVTGGIIIPFDKKDEFLDMLKIAIEKSEKIRSVSGGGGKC